MSTAAIQILSRRRPDSPPSNRSRWLSARFVAGATATSAMGLANIVRFPYLLSRHGGGAFLIAYLIALVVLALPLLMADLMIARRGRLPAAVCYGNLAQEEGHTSRWARTGIIASGAGLLILAVYAEAAGTSASLLASAGSIRAGWVAVAWQGIFLGLASLFASQGIRLGVRPVQVRLLQVELLLLTGLLASSVTASPEFRRTVPLVFQPDFARFTWLGLVDAGRLALLTVGVGFGTAFSYGCLIPEQASISRTSVVTLIPAGAIVLLGAVAAVSVAPSPMHSGFLLLAGLGASVALLHPIIEQVIACSGLSRIAAALAVGATAWIFAAALALTNDSQLLEGMVSLGVVLFLPAAALCGVLFVGWVMSRRTTRTELGLQPTRLFVIWRWMIRYLAPVLLGAMLVLGVIDLVTQ